MRVIVVGYTGFVGRAVYQYLKEVGYDVEGFNSHSPYIDAVCDVVVNCAGNSRKFTSENNNEFTQSIEDGVLERLKQIESKRIIHISTVDVHNSESSMYGQQKIFVESRIRRMYPSFSILRLSALVGEGLKKNVVFDIVNEKPLFVTRTSTYCFISTKVIAELIVALLRQDFGSLVLDVGGEGLVAVEQIAQILGKEVISFGNCDEHYPAIDITTLKRFIPVKKSYEYIEEFNDTRRR